MPPLIPSLAGRRTFARAFLSLLLFELVALCGEWIVHQVEYLIVYGTRFQAVMETTPHRYYMADSGSVLALGGTAAIAACLVMLYGRRHAISLLRARIPARFHRLVPTTSPQLTWRAVLMTAFLLAACQVAIYAVQENLEWMYAGLSAPGIWVLIGSQHLTVLPLHALVALCGSVLLWTLSVLCRGSESTLEAVRVLAERFGGRPHMSGRFPPAGHRLPHRRLLRTARGLRSPPIAA